MRMSVLLEQLELAERDAADTPKEPVTRALIRISDAYGRGGEFEALQATIRRIDATKDQFKKLGIVDALKDILRNNGTKGMSVGGEKLPDWTLSPDGVRMIEAALRKAKRAL